MVNLVANNVSVGSDDKYIPETFNPNIGDHIFILDCSWVHHPGDVYNDRNWLYNEAIAEGLYCAEAEVIGQPYMKTIHGESKDYEVRMVDVRVVKNNEEFAIVAMHKNDHATSREDLREKLFHRQAIDLEFEGSEVDDPSMLFC